MAGSINAIGLGAAADLEAQISAPVPTIATTVRIGASRDGPAAAAGTASGASTVTSSVGNGGADARATQSMSTVVVTMSGR